MVILYKNQEKYRPSLLQINLPIETSSILTIIDLIK